MAVYLDDAQNASMTSAAASIQAGKATILTWSGGNGPGTWSTQVDSTLHRHRSQPQGHRWWR